jgi:hypothetical protein
MVQRTVDSRPAQLQRERKNHVHGEPWPSTPALLGLLSLSSSAGLVCPAAADPIEVQGGTVVLTISGLELDLPPPDEGCVYKVSGSFALTDDAKYDGRDVIDEVCGDELAAGTWISLGYFDAGDPAAVVASIELTDDWTAQHDFWGATWNVRGGIFTFDSELGAKPALTACIDVGGGMAMLLHRFFLTASGPTTQAAMLEEFAQSPVPRAAWLACTKNRFGTVYTTKRPETRNRGSLEPSRPAVLEHLGIEFRIPDDGFVWLVRSGDGPTDFLDRMAPSLPDVSIEVAYLAADDCEAGLASISTEKRDVPPQNLPDGWVAGPQLVVDDRLELTTCYPTADGVVVVGIFQGTPGADVAYLAPMLTAIADAVDGH